MANTKSAKKNIRKSENRRLINASRRTAIKTSIKKVNGALDSGAPQEVTEKLLRTVSAELGRAKSKGTIHKNAAARRMSRLAKKVAAAYETK